MHLVSLETKVVMAYRALLVAMVLRGNVVTMVPEEIKVNLVNLVCRVMKERKEVKVPMVTSGSRDLLEKREKLVDLVGLAQTDFQAKRGKKENRDLELVSSINLHL